MTREHAVFTIAQVIINDGNGSQCGYSYETRLKFARQDTLANSSRWNTMCKNTAIHLAKYHDEVYLPIDVLKASIEIYNHYQQHIKECDNENRNV